MPGDDKRKPSPKKTAAQGNDRKNLRSCDDHHIDQRRIKAKPFWPVAAATSSALRHDRFEKVTRR